MREFFKALCGSSAVTMPCVQVLQAFDHKCPEAVEKEALRQHRLLRDDFHQRLKGEFLPA